MHLKAKSQHKPHSLNPQEMLIIALKEEGFLISDSIDSSLDSIKMDLRLTIALGGAATSTIDATYETYSVDSCGKSISLSALKDMLGRCLVVSSSDQIAMLRSPVGVYAYEFRGGVIHKGKSNAYAVGDEHDLCTLYRAMQNVHQDLPAFDQLSLDQKKLLATHIDMLANYLRK